MNDYEEKQGEHFGRMLRKVQENVKTLILTDEEWMSIIDKDRDGLPMCCANISALRDNLIEIARDGGEVGFLHSMSLCRALTWCFPDHDVPSNVIQKILDQLGWEIFEYHEPNTMEFS